MAALVAVVLSSGPRGDGSVQAQQAQDESRLRELAERLLTPPLLGPGAEPITVQLLPGQVPADSPLSLTLPPNSRVVGSELRRSAEIPAGGTVVLDVPGTAAEILDDEVRAVLCPDKVDTEEWLEAHRVAHSVGLRSNITIMFGAVEQPVHWARHMVRTRALQAETGGFTEFVPLPFVHMATPLFLQGRGRRGPTFREALLMHAVARIAYTGYVDNIQVSWVKLGAEGARQALQAGANDLGGTLMDENISRAAGASHGQRMDESAFRAVVEPLGRPLEQRTTLYGRVAAAASR